MTAFNSRATISWLAGPPPEGVPRLTVDSNSFPALPLNLDPEASTPLATSPGELLAGAIGSAVAWMAAKQLVNEGTQARELVAYVTLTVTGESGDDPDWVLTGIACELAGYVPGVDQVRLQAVAQAAMARAIEALGLRPDRIAVTVEALLEGA